MEITKHGIKAETPKEPHIEKYKLACSNCKCEFIANWGESESIEKGIISETMILGNFPKIIFRCPECGELVGIPRMSPLHLIEYNEM